MGGPSFVAIDFETANFNAASPCAVGLVKVLNGEIAYSVGETFRPPAGFDSFSSRNISIHGITPSHVAGKPRFGDLWPEFERFIDGLPLIAHNAPFDMAVLRASLHESGLEVPSLDYSCTVSMSRKYFTMRNHTLAHSAVASGIEWDEESHHDALYDAKACAGIALFIAQEKQEDEFYSLLKSLRLYPKQLKEEIKERY